MDGTNSDGDGDGICFPYDVLLVILRQLPCRALAGSRRVCRTWRTIIDAHKLLLPHFFPRGALPGHLHQQLWRPRGAHDGPVFRRPLFWHDRCSVLHYCNGLILLNEGAFDYYICNPATLRYACLPPSPGQEPMWMSAEYMFLAFDPAVPLNYQVLLLPREKIQPTKEKIQLAAKEKIEPAEEKIQLEQQLMHIHVPVVEEQPKDRVISVLVFSSETDEWASREFVPGHCTPRHLYDMVNAPQASYVKIWKSAQYWQGSLYVHCWNHVIMILRNSEGAYDMAQLPGESYVKKGYECLFELSQRSLLVSYERGIHFVALDKFQLHVWTLTESTDGQIGWMLAHATDLSPYNHKVVKYTKGLLSLFQSRNIEENIYDEDDGRSDTTDDVDSDSDDDEEEDIHEVDGFDSTTGDVGVGGHSEGGDAHEDDDGGTKREEVFEYTWDSDEDNFIDLDEGAAHLGDEEYGGYRIMGLHPHKEVVLFQTYSGVVAYHIRTSRMQCLGWHLVKYPHSHSHGANATFPYRPCYVDALPASN
ncbi:hypothetical protein VPH35_107171 [Triticum aestivum]